VPAPGGNSFQNIKGFGGEYGVVTTGSGDCWDEVEAHGHVVGFLSAPHGEGLPDDLQPKSEKVTFSQKTGINQDDKGWKVTAVKVEAKQSLENAEIAVYLTSPVRKVLFLPKDIGRIDLLSKPKNDQIGAPDDPNLIVLKIKEPKVIAEGTVLEFAVLNDSTDKAMIKRICVVSVKRDSCD
jgi:hypothetical protein